MNKNVLILSSSPCRAGNSDLLCDEFQGFLDCLDNPTRKGVIYGKGVWKVGDVKQTPIMQEAFELGKNL